MKKYTIYFLLVAFLLLLVAACFVTYTKSENVKPEIQQKNFVSTTSYEYTSNTQGYSLYLPNNYKVLATSQNQTEFIYSSNNPDDGLVWIDTEPANGRTIDQVAKDVIEDQGGVLDINTNNVVIDGEKALVLSPLTGQNLIRRIIVIHNDILYQMNFTPEFPQMGESYKNVEDIYKSVIDTFRFID